MASICRKRGVQLPLTWWHLPALVAELGIPLMDTSIQVLPPAGDALGSLDGACQKWGTC